MARTSTGGATGGGTCSEPVVQKIAFLSAMIAIGASWPLVHQLIPPGDSFAMIDLVREHWAHRHNLEPWLDERWAWLALHNYHLWFALSALPGVVAASIVQAFDRKTAWPIFYAPLGWVAGGALGIWLYQSFRDDSWPLAVMMPATFGFLGGVIAARLGSWTYCASIRTWRRDGSSLAHGSPHGHAPAFPRNRRPYLR